MIIKKCILSLLFSLGIPIISHAASLETFCSDGCTHFPNGTRELPTKWLHCCIDHDLKYWAGGSWHDRRLADEGLRKCVSATGEPEAAELMFLGVRIFGSPFSNETYRWGFGWNDHRAYQAPSEDEQNLINSMTPADPESLPLCI